MLVGGGSRGGWNTCMEVCEKYEVLLVCRPSDRLSVSL